MPTVQLPFSKGLVTSNNEGDWLDYLPVNMLAVPKEVLNSAGYMRSWPGLSQKYNTVGLARGAIFNIIDDTIYRVQGDSLTDGEGNVLAVIGANGGGYAPLAYSNNTTAIVSEGKLKFWDSEEETITELKNWEEGERGESTISDEWSPKYGDGSDGYAEIPLWRPTNATFGMGFSIDVTLEDATTKQWIIGCRVPGAVQSGIYVENSLFVLQRDNNLANNIEIGVANIGDNTITYSGTAIFAEEIGVVGCVADGDIPKEFLTGFVTKLSMINNDTGAASTTLLRSRNYEALIQTTRKSDPENPDNPPEQDQPTKTFLENTLNESITSNNTPLLNVVGGAAGIPALSGNLTLSPGITSGNFYVVRCNVETEGTNASGFTVANGILPSARVSGEENSIFSVFRCTSNTTNFTMFTENPECTFTNIFLEQVTHGYFLNMPALPYVLFKAESEVIEQPGTDFDIGEVIDVTRNRARYAWLKRGSNQFGVTDLGNEQRPDYLAPFYSSELKPGDSLGIASWRGYIVVFGRHITEYFNLTGQTEPVYVNVQSLTVRCGVVGTGAKCEYLDSFAIVGSPELENNSVYLINQGQYVEIATRRIQKILREYTEEELSTLYIEPVKFDAHDMIIIHLPRHVLVYDHIGSSQGEKRWSVLKSDTIGDKVYRGIYHINADNVWSVGDKEQNIISEFDYSSSSHVGEKVEFSLISQMVQARNKRLFDLEVDTVSGRSLADDRIAVSLTFDGISYNNEKWIYFNSPANYTRRILLRRMGYMRNNVAFKLRWITDTPTSISNLRVRFE